MYTHVLKQNKRIAQLLCALLLTSPSAVWALSDDIEQPVNIEADTVMFDNEKGIADYEGNVKVVQGSIIISAAKVNIQAPGNEIKLIVSTGSPAVMEQTMDDGLVIHGEGKTIRYNVEDERIFLTGDAKLEQGKDVISNNNIEYRPETGELFAGGKKDSGRVKAIFHPNNKADGEKKEKK
jgi:lipopolysaccharide export system protein LptA